MRMGNCSLSGLLSSFYDRRKGTTIRSWLFANTHSDINTHVCKCYCIKPVSELQARNPQWSLYPRYDPFLFEASQSSLIEEGMMLGVLIRYPVSISNHKMRTQCTEKMKSFVHSLFQRGITCLKSYCSRNRKVCQSFHICPTVTWQVTDAADLEHTWNQGGPKMIVSASEVCIYNQQ